MCLMVRLFPLFVALGTCDGASDCSVPKITAIGGVYVDYDKTRYVQNGNSVEIYCTSDFSSQLEISDWNKLYAEIINSTTIRTVLKVSAQYTGFLECRNTCASDFWSDYEQIEGDYFPEIRDFDCFSENFDLLHITWSTPNDQGNYSLSYIRSDGTVISQVCRKKMWYKRSYTCVFDLNNLEDPDEKDPHVILHLQICNYFGCVNQTRDFALLRITKLAAPKDLNMSYFTNAYGKKSIFFDWMPYRNSLVSEMELYFLIEYWLTDISGMKPRVSISEKHLFYRRMTSSHIIKLPCPDKQYTLRASIRPADAPSKYTSNYAYVTFHTEPDPGAEVLDPICNIIPVVETPPVMVYKIQLLRKYVAEEIEKFKQFKKPIQDKAAVIKMLQ